MILLDANVLMYAAGAAHAHKASSLALLERVARGDLEAGADVEVLQEILHRYRALGRWDDGKRLYDLVRRVVPTWLPIEVAALDLARRLLDSHPHLTARDALHAAVYFDAGASAFCTFDRDFDAISGLRRVEPEDAV